MADKRRKFDAEFREGAVRIVAETGEPIKQVAKDLGINEATLAGWGSRARKAGGSAGDSEELARLRQENARLKKENLVGASLQMAVATRGGSVDGVIFHPDRGSEYTSAAYNNLCGRLGVVQSMGRVGSAPDNAAAESFNSLIRVEYIHRHRFATRAEARVKIATWITDFYNTRRRHSAAKGLPPVEFERIISEARTSHHQEDLAA